MNTPIPPTIPSDSYFSTIRTASNLVASGEITTKTAHLLATQEGVLEPLGPAITTFYFTSDVAGKIAFTSVTGIGQQTGYAFSTSYNYNPIIILTPANDNAGKNQGAVYIQSTTEQFTINFAISDGGDIDYVYNYFVISSIGST